MWRLRHRGTAPGDEQHESVLAEAEAVLSGSCVRWFIHNERRVPRWAWLNAVAHGSPDDLRALAATRAGTDSWAAAIGRVAEHLLGAGGDPESVAQLQSALLIPLELQVLADCHRDPMRPRDLVAMVERDMPVRGSAPLANHHRCPAHPDPEEHGRPGPI